MDYLLRFLSFLQLLLLKALEPFFWYFNRTEKASIPANHELILHLSACQIAKKIKDGEMTSETVVKAYIDRIKEVNPIVNAVVEDRYEEALKEARLCDKRLNSGEVSKAQLEIKMPLYGVPFTVKESCSLKGLSYTGCSLLRQGIKATDDSPVVASMKNAGGIALCVTNTPEMCSSLDAANLVFGRTWNPYDSRRIAGGSSGGEAALLGAGASLIGIGSDIAGSIRVPSLFNGIFGHKPTPGIVPIVGHYPMSDEKDFQKCLVLGPMARYVEDLVLAMRIMSGEKSKILHLDETIDIKKLRIFYSEDAGNSFGTESVDSSIKRAIKRATSHLETCGCKVSEATVGPLSELLEISSATIFHIKNMPKVLINPDDPKSKCNGQIELLKAFLGMSRYSKSAISMQIVTDMKGFMRESSAMRYQKKGQALREKFLEMLGEDGVFLFPSYVCAAPVQGKIQLQITAGIYSLIANIFGFPATQIPMGLNKQGLPIGFQVIAGPNQDRLCLAIAREMEKRFGGWISPSSCNVIH